MTLSHQDIADRYRRTYNLGDDIGYDHAQKHWELERRLTDQLLKSQPDNRWETFSRCYTQLYEELPWLNRAVALDQPLVDLRQWSLLMPKNATILEIGSGNARLLKYLSALGHDCVGSEITSERGKKHSAEETLIDWHMTDGVHLREFEPAQRYDVVISNQVIEHLHPTDIKTHFCQAHAILKKGGKYIFTTPHVGSGPHDLSQVFGLDHSICMHLKEYNYIELGKIAKACGFNSVRAIFPPSRIFQLMPITFESRLYFQYLCAWDVIDRILSLPPRVRRAFRLFLKTLLVPSINMWISAEK